MENNDCETTFNSRVADSQLVPKKKDNEEEAKVSS